MCGVDLYFTHTVLEFNHGTCNAVRFVSKTWHYHYRSKHTGSDSEAFWLRSVIKWPLWPAYSQNQARSYITGSNFLRPVQFCSSKEGLDQIVQNQPRSDLDGLVRFWPNESGPETNQCARIIRPAPGQSFRADPDQMHIGSSMFTVITDYYYYAAHKLMM